MKYAEQMLRDDALLGKVIVVTGGGSGLGMSMTRYFLQLGAKVAITSRKLEKLEDTAKALEEETGGQCFPIACDVRNIDEVEAMHEHERLTPSRNPTRRYNSNNFS